MRWAAGGFALLSIFAAAPEAWAQGQLDCAPPPRRGGIVGQVEEHVTQPIGREGCAKSSEDPDACTSVRFTYEPAAIPYQKHGRADLTYEPRFCNQPKGNRQFNLADGSSEIFIVDAIIGTVAVLSNVAAKASVTVTHGSLTATAEVASKVRPQTCTSMALSYDPPSIHVGNNRKAQITFLPEECLDVPGSADNATFSSSVPAIAKISGEGGRVTGIRVGPAQITAKLAGMTATASVTIVNDGPPCENLEMGYANSRLPVGGTTGLRDRTSPYLSYWPPNCARPEREPEFVAVTPAVAKVERNTGVVTGLAPGTARIGVSHETLHAIAEMQIIAVPPCGEIALRYNPRRVPLRNEASAELSYQAAPENDTYLGPCQKPDGTPQFSAEPAASIEFLSGDSTIRGLAIGAPKLTVRHGSLSSSTFVEIIDGAPCTTLTASYDPPTIAIGQTSRIRLVHQPQGCVPAGPREFSVLYSDSTELGLDSEGNASGQRAGKFLVYVGEGENSAKNPINTTTRIAVVGGCTAFGVHASPPGLQLGAESHLIFEFDPDRCRPAQSPKLKWIKSISNDAVSLKIAPDGSLFLVGEHGGQSTIVVHPGVLGVGADGSEIEPPAVTLSVSVTAPPCAGIEIKYPSPKFNPKPFWAGQIRTAGGPPTLTYSPKGCTRPGGSPRYTSVDANFVVDAKTGEIELHPARGTATLSYITVTHGTLTADAKVGDY